jgi:hypothetical protein
VQCQTETEQAQEVREQAKDKVRVEEEDEEQEERWVVVDHPHVLQGTAFVRTADLRLVIRSASLAAGRFARNAEQK